MGQRVMRVETMLQGWTLTVWLIAIGHFGVGVGFIIGQEMSMPTRGSGLSQVFSNTAEFPWWAWAFWAVIGSTMILWRHTRILGLFVTAVWYSLYGSLLCIGIVSSGGPYQSVAVYMLLAALHILAFWVEYLLWRERDTLPMPSSVVV